MIATPSWQLRRAKAAANNTVRDNASIHCELNVRDRALNVENRKPHTM